MKHVGTLGKCRRVLHHVRQKCTAPVSMGPTQFVLCPNLTGRNYDYKAKLVL
jgi:hypothetical protein